MLQQAVIGRSDRAGQQAGPITRPGTDACIIAHKFNKAAMALRSDTT